VVAVVEAGVVVVVVVAVVAVVVVVLFDLGIEDPMHGLGQKHPAMERNPTAHDVGK
jgi:hypothetical protein